MEIGVSRYHHRHSADSHRNVVWIPLRETAKRHLAGGENVQFTRNCGTYSSQLGR